MVTPRQALEVVLGSVHPLGREQVHLGGACGRVLATDLPSPRDVPPFRNSAMDGYAVRHSDLRSDGGPTRLTVVATLAAGDVPGFEVKRGTAAAIMTGAVVPPGADTVVRREDTSGDGEQVTIRVAPPSGSNVREPGEDLRAGEVALPAGRVLRPSDIGVAASLGYAVLSVYRRPTVSILTTGGELVELGQPLGPGQIANSNAYTLAAAVEDAGGVARLMGTVADERVATGEAIVSALAADAVISTGGVSMGNFDLVRSVLSEIGVEERFWKIAQKPGKPLAFGVHGRVPVFGLPGNPVSALVCFELYVRPALRALGGHATRHHPIVYGEVLEDIRTATDLTEFVRVTLTPIDGANGWRVRPTGTQSSGALRSMSLCDGLLVSPPGVETVPAGSIARILQLGSAPVAAVPL